MQRKAKVEFNLNVYLFVHLMAVIIIIWLLQLNETGLLYSSFMNVTVCEWTLSHWIRIIRTTTTTTSIVIMCSNFGDLEVVPHLIAVEELTAKTRKCTSCPENSVLVVRHVNGYCLPCYHEACRHKFRWAFAFYRRSLENLEKIK